MANWPLDNSTQLDAFYTRPDGSALWEVRNLVYVPCPFKIYTSWDPPVAYTKGIRCHKKVADSLQRVLADIWKTFEYDQEAIKAVGMDRFGGSYFFRPKRGSNNLSLHAYGAALDWDPVHNTMDGNNTNDHMDIRVAKCFEKEGWRWGKSYGDPMHFEGCGGGVRNDAPFIPVPIVAPTVPVVVTPAPIVVPVVVTPKPEPPVPGYAELFAEILKAIAKIFGFLNTITPPPVVVTPVVPKVDAVDGKIVVTPPKPVVIVTPPVHSEDLPINDATVALVKRWESFVDHPYDDRGALAIGYGHTSKAGAPMVAAGMKITEAEATIILHDDLESFATVLRKLITAPVSENQFGAMVSLAYNIGIPNFSGSTLLKKVNAKDYAGAAAQFDVWVKSRNPKTGLLERLPGLVNRREGERILFETPK